MRAETIVGEFKMTRFPKTSEELRTCCKLSLVTGRVNLNACIQESHKNFGTALTPN